jgi:hypothetical protein
MKLARRALTPGKRARHFGPFAVKKMRGDRFAKREKRAPKESLGCLAARPRSSSGAIPMTQPCGRLMPKDLAGFGGITRLCASDERVRPSLALLRGATAGRRLKIVHLLRCPPPPRGDSLSIPALIAPSPGCMAPRAGRRPKGHAHILSAGLRVQPSGESND